MLFSSSKLVEFIVIVHCSRSQEATQSDQHMQRLARLEFEFLQRKNLATELKSVRSRCEEMQNEIEEKRKKLNSINPMLTSIIEVSLLCTYSYVVHVLYSCSKH